MSFQPEMTELMRRYLSSLDCCNLIMNFGFRFSSCMRIQSGKTTRNDVLEYSFTFSAEIHIHVLNFRPISAEITLFLWKLHGQPMLRLVKTSVGFTLTSNNFHFIKVFQFQIHSYIVLEIALQNWSKIHSTLIMQWLWCWFS